MMESEAIKKLEDQLNCPICMDTYTNPKQLQCHHVYCQQCLVRLVFRDQQGQLILNCPNCRQVTPIPAKGVAGLQSAFQINKFLEIVEEHKKVKVASPEMEEADSVSTTPHENITVCCPEHGGREVELYCNTCEETICFKCIMKDERHHSHEYKELNNAFEKYERELLASLEPMEKQLKAIEKAQVQFDTSHHKISTQQMAIKDEIHKAIACLHETLDVRKNELISQLDQLTQAKLKSLTAQKDQIDITQARLSSYLLFVKESLKKGNQAKTLLMKNSTVTQVKELTTLFRQDILKPNAEADMIFSTLADLTAECHDYGQVSTVGSLAKCYAIGKGVETAVVGEKSTAILNSNDRPYKVSTHSITCDLESETTGTIKSHGSIESRVQRVHEVSFQPIIKGRHQLHIKVEGQHIKGSPYPISAREKLGTPIQTVDDIVLAPEGIAVNQNGEMVVTEFGRQCVSVLDSNGERLQSFVSCGPRQGQFQSPHGVAVDDKGNIFVTYSLDHRIWKFTAQGELITAVGTEDSETCIFFPTGIAVNASNGRVYVGSWEGYIHILNADLSHFDTFGERGTGEGKFNNPQDIACDSSGNIHVTDCDNHCIQVFTSGGEFLRMFGKHGRNGGELDEPHGVAIDSGGRVYVSERNNHRISVFTSEGQFVTSFGNEGINPGELCYPRQLAVDSSGVVYVCDLGNNRIQLF